MSLFGSPTAQPAQSGGLFSFNKPSTTPAAGTSSLFGAPQQMQQQPSLPSFSFSAPKTQAQQSGGLLGTSTQAQPGASTFGQGQQQQAGGLFGASQNQQQGGGLFGNTQNQQQSGGLFSTAAQPQPGSVGFGQGSQQTQQPAQPSFDQTLLFGQSRQGQPEAQSLWDEGRGMNTFRSIPVQMNIVKNRWDPTNLSSPLRTYLYQHVESETDALKYRPSPGEDEDKWDQAVSNRPGPAWVPLLVQGFFQLGRKAQIQMEAIQRCNMMLQEINTSLDVQLDRHRQNVATRLEECKRRQAASAQRTLALAVKVQILRNRGYVMDNAEEELKVKLENLQRMVFDPSLNAREQEIWARMLGIRERAKRLKMEMDRTAPTANADEDDSTLDEETVRAAKKVSASSAPIPQQTQNFAPVVFMSALVTDHCFL